MIVRFPPARRLAFAAFLIAGGLVFAAPPAAAEERVILQGQHSQAQVEAACEGVGGFNVQGKSGGYGCYNPSNGVLVACDNGGTCIGFIPHAATPPRNRALDVLGPAVRNGLEADPFVEPRPRPRPAPPIRPGTVTRQ